MKHFPRFLPALLCVFTAATPALAATATWNPVSSDDMLNTAVGGGALANTDLDEDGGCHNTAAGYEALHVDTSGSYNTAIGVEALVANTTGNNNTGVGAYTLSSNTGGSNNTASGYYALHSNSGGNDNTAEGYNALYSNTTGANNTGAGYQTLHNNTTGSENTASGFEALYANTTGGHNIALGYQAGYNVTTGSYNIEIGTTGSSSDADSIQIGVQGTQKSALIAGIYGTAVTGAAVYVTSSGHLGVQASSERYKTDITTMPDVSAKLADLRPVTFHYKNDPSGTLQYGLIAEEVAKVYPELVLRSPDGRIDGVRYEELAPILLNEVQQQKAQLRDMQQQVAELKQINESMQAAVTKLLSKDERVAMR